MARAVHRHFASDPVQFENFAAEMRVRPQRRLDRGHLTYATAAAMPRLPIGPQDDPVRRGRLRQLEAKCYDPDGGELASRLISRIKHRQFGLRDYGVHSEPQSLPRVENEILSPPLVRREYEGRQQEKNVL